MVEAVVGKEQLVARGCEPFAERRRLRGNVVRAAHHDELGVLGRQAGQPAQRGHDPQPDELERRPHLQLLDVLGQIARRHAFVDVLGPGERGELLDARLHVVACDLLAGVDRGQVDLVDDGFVRLDHAVGHLDAELALCPEDGQPEVALEDHLAPR